MSAQPKSAVASASSLILLQMGTRLLTFALNQVLVRLVSANVFGAANIQLELLLSTILFLSREAIRTVLVRKQADDPEAVKQRPSLSSSDERTAPRVDRLSRADANRSNLHNISLLPIPIGVVLSSVVAYAYVAHLSPTSLRGTPAFKYSVALYVVGALSELAYEPLYIRALQLRNPALRVQAEGVAVLAKCIASVVAVFALPSLAQRWILSSKGGSVLDLDLDRSVGLLAFGIGQVCYGASSFLVYFQWFARTIGVKPTLGLYVVRIGPTTEDGRSSEQISASGPQVRSRLDKYLDSETLSLCWSMTKQGLLKHVLTEGDKLAVARFATLEDQGGYALASNYGSLVARLLFQPIEDATRLVFAQSLQSVNPATGKDDRSGASAPPVPALGTLDEVSSLIATLLRAHLLLGMVFVCFGPPLSTAFLYIMAGPRWALTTSAPAILGAYTWYVPVMGINGITEGFLQSTASRDQVERYNKILIASSCSFVASLWLSQQFPVAAFRPESGETLLVWANAFSLGIRALYCWSFLVKYFDYVTRRWRTSTSDRDSEAKEGKEEGRQIVDRLRPGSVLPSLPALLSFAAAFAILRATAPRIMPSRQTMLAAVGGRLPALRMLLPILVAGAACFCLPLVACIVFERSALIGTVTSLRRRRGGPPTERAKTT